MPYSRLCPDQTQLERVAIRIRRVYYGGEWPLLSVLPELDVIVLNKANNSLKIFPPKKYRPLILEKMHKTGKKSNSMYMRARLTYTWPPYKKILRHM